jgi:integrase
MATIEKRTAGDGVVSYRVKVRLRGHLPQTETFTRLTDAKLWAQRVEADIRRNRHFKTAEAERHTLAEAIDRYFESYLPALRSRRLLGAQLRWWREQAGHLRLSDMTAAEIIRHRDELRARPRNRRGAISDATLNRYIAALSIVLTKACREWEWLEQVPTSRVKRLKEPRGRTRSLSEGERHALLGACRQSANPHLYAIVVLALCTGARKTEILRLRWADLDLARRRVVFRETKNGEQRGVPLTAPARSVLASLPTGEPQSLLFPSPRKADQPVAIQCAWESAVSAAGLRDFRFHDLRHTAASYLAMSGATTSDIAAILGHKSLAMVQRYQHLTESHAGAVAERMAAQYLDVGSSADQASAEPADDTV